MSEKQLDPTQSDIKKNMPLARSSDKPIIFGQPKQFKKLHKTGEEDYGKDKEQAEDFRLEASFHSGPLPTVSDFAGYEQICAGASRDILDMAKSDLAHAQWMDRWQLLGDLMLKLSLIAAAIIILLGMISGAIYAALNGHDGIAYTIASGSGLALVAGAFFRFYLPKTKEAPVEKNSKAASKKSR